MLLEALLVMVQSILQTEHQEIQYLGVKYNIVIVMILCSFLQPATERLRITSDGKIGINQSTPQTTFHSTGTTNGQQATFGIDDSGLKISTFQKTDNDAGVILDAQKSSNGTLTFATTGTGDFV